MIRCGPVIKFGLKYMTHSWSQIQSFHQNTKRDFSVHLQKCTWAVCIIRHPPVTSLHPVPERRHSCRSRCRQNSSPKWATADQLPALDMRFLGVLGVYYGILAQVKSTFLCLKLSDICSRAPCSRKVPSPVFWCCRPQLLHLFYLRLATLASHSVSLVTSQVPATQPHMSEDSPTS